MLKYLLEYLDGKKAKIVAVSAIILNILTRMGYLDAQLAVDIFSILNILAGGAAVATDRNLGKRNFQGVRTKYDR